MGNEGEIIYKKSGKVRLSIPVLQVFILIQVVSLAFGVGNLYLNYKLYPFQKTLDNFANKIEAIEKIVDNYVTKGEFTPLVEDVTLIKNHILNDGLDEE